MNLPCIDVLSPIDELAGRIRHGRMHRFSVYRTSAHNGYYIETLLRRYGVRVWGRRIDGEKRSFLVKRTQAVWAEYILCRAGVPLACELLDSRNAEYAQQHPAGGMPTPWAEKGVPAVSFIDHLGDWMAKLSGRAE